MPARRPAVVVQLKLSGRLSALLPFAVIVEVSPEEFAKIQTHELTLPKGWLLGEEMPKPADDAGGE